MKRKLNFAFLGLIICLLALSSCGSRYLHSPETPPILGISEKGQFSSSATIGVNSLGLSAQNGFSGGIDLGYSPIKYVAIQGSLGFRNEKDAWAKASTFHERLSAGLYYKHDISPEFNFLFDLYLSNSQFLQSIKYNEGTPIRLNKQTWNSSLGLHVTKGKIGFSYVIEGGYIDLFKINQFGNTHSTEMFNEVNSLTEIDTSPYFQYNSVIRYNRPKLSYYALFSYIVPVVESRYINELNVALGVQYDFRKKSSTLLPKDL